MSTRPSKPSCGDLFSIVATQADGRLLIVERQLQNYRLRRLEASGATDATVFTSPVFSSPPLATVLDNGRILVAGGNGAKSLQQFLPDGTLDGNYRADLGSPYGEGGSFSLELPGRVPVDGRVLVVTPVAGGRALIGGTFHAAGGRPSTGLALLGTDGRAVAGFDVGTGLEYPGGLVAQLAVDVQDRVLIAGDFTSVGGLPRSGVARLLPSGTVDPSFQATLPNAFRPSLLRLHPVDGSIVLGDNAGGVVRLSTMGALDPAFSSGNALVSGLGSSGIALRSLHVDGNRGVYLAGNFRPNRVSGNGRYGLARLLPTTGALDEGFETARGGEPLGIPEDGLQFGTISTLANQTVLAGGSSSTSRRSSSPVRLRFAKRGWSGCWSHLTPPARFFRISSRGFCRSRVSATSCRSRTAA